jgi:hypothetical protein
MCLFALVSTKYDSFKAYGGVEVALHVFILYDIPRVKEPPETIG